jgi:hypothetical protein
VCHALLDAQKLSDVTCATQAILVDNGMRGPQPQHASAALGAQRVGPRQIEVQHDSGILQVHTFGDEIRGEQQGDTLMGGGRRAAMGARGKGLKQRSARNCPTGDARLPTGEQSHAGNVGEGAKQRLHGAGVLGEGDDGHLAVALAHVPEVRGPQPVGAGRCAVMIAQGAQSCGVSLEHLDHGLGCVWRVECVFDEQFGEAELHVGGLIAHEPAGELLGGGMTSRLEG